MADNKHIHEKEGSSSAESGKSRNFPKKRSLPAPFAAFVMIKNEASSQVPRSKISPIKPAEQKTRLESPSKIKVVSSQVPTTSLAMIKPAEETTRVENPGKIEPVSSQGSTIGPAMVKPAKETTRMGNPGKIEAESSQGPTIGPALIKPAEETKRVESPIKIEAVSSQGLTTGPAMVKPAEETTRMENPDPIEAVSSQVPTTDLAVIKPIEQTSMVDNSPFVQNPTTPPRNSPSSDLERNSHVSSKWESLVEFQCGMNASSRRDEDIRTGNEPMLGGMEDVHQGIQHLIDRVQRLSVDNQSFFQNPRTPPISLLAFDFGGSAHVLSEREGLFEFCYGTNPLSKPDADISGESCPTLCGMGGVHQSIQHSSDGIQRLSPPSIQNSRTVPITYLTSDVEGNGRASFDSNTIFEFYHGMNASSRQDENIRSGNEPMLGDMEDVHQGIQHLIDRVQRLSADNVSFFQNRRTPPMNPLVFDFEESAHVSSEREGLFEFCYGMNPLSKAGEDIRSGNCSTLGDMEGVHQGIQPLSDGIQRLSGNSPPFIQNSRTVPITFLTSDVEGNARASFNRNTIFEFYHGMNASCSRDEDIHSGNEQMLGAVGGFNQDTQHLWEEMHRINVNIPSPSEDPYLSFEISPSDIDNLGIGLLTVGIYRENSPNVSPGRLYGMEFKSYRQYRDLNSSEDPLDKRVVDDAKQLCSAFNENIQQSENPDLTGSGISEEYLKLYKTRNPDDYDFAMNIIAHIELLNDNSWTATVSYFDENVKRMVTSIWNETHTIFQNTVKLQGYNRLMVLKLIMHFTRLSVNENFTVEAFLKYCVLLCQLGVIARKNIFKEAPIYVIVQIRKRLKLLKPENLVQLMLDIAAKDYTKRQHKM